MVGRRSVWYGVVIGLAILGMLPACGGDGENSGGGSSQTDAVNLDLSNIGNSDLVLSDTSAATDSTDSSSKNDVPDSALPDLNSEMDVATTDSVVTLDVDLPDVDESTDGSIAEPHLDIATTDDVSEPADVAVVPDSENDIGQPVAWPVINEIVCSPVSGEDWIELFILGTGSVLLSDYTLVDAGIDHIPAALPAITVNAGDYVVVWAMDDAPADGSPYVPFKLGKDDSVTLASAEEIIDSLSWVDGDAPAGTSYGRYPDGTGGFQTLAPTPGLPNVLLNAPPLTDPFPKDQVLTIQLDMEQSDWNALLADPLAEVYYPATLHYGGITVENVAIRTKGNSSLNSLATGPSHRYSFKIDVNEYVSGQKILGLKKFVLNNGFKDPSLLRETLAYELAREANLPAPRTAFADVTVAGEHLGVYTLVEVVDSDFIDNWFDNNDGDLFKPEPPAGNLGWSGSNAASYPNIGLETNEDTSDYSALINFLNVLNNGPAANYPTVLDITNALTYIAVQTILVNLDSLLGPGHNYYLYEQDGVFSLISWDTNEAFGNFKCSCSATDLIHFKIDEPTCGAPTTKPLIGKLLANTPYHTQYRGILTDIVDDLFTEAGMNQRIDTYADLIRPYVQKDTAKFFTTAEFEANLTADVVKGQVTTFGLKNFVKQRRAALVAQLSGTSPATNGGKGACLSSGGGGGGGKCPDGICDAAEKQNPNLCPQDCL